MCIRDRVDLDRQGNCAHRLRVHQQTYDPDTNPDGPGISALLTGRAAIEDSILQDVRPNLDLLPSTPEISIAVDELQDADRRAMTHGRTPRGHVWLDDVLSQRLAPALGIYRYIVIDCPPDMDRLKRPLFRFADHVIAPTQLSSIPVRMTARNTHEIATFKEHAQLLLVLPTIYRWFDEERMAILIPDGRGGQEVVAAMGLAGGQLPTSTHDGWRCERTDLGATLVRDDQLLKIADQEEFRACGFSPRGSVFILATSPNLTVLKRDLALEQKL